MNADTSNSQVDGFKMRLDKKIQFKLLTIHNSCRSFVIFKTISIFLQQTPKVMQVPLSHYSVLHQFQV